MTKCCHCEKKIVGEPNFCVPEDFPRDPHHGGLPLCDACGGGRLPTLDEICRKLDAERLRQWRRQLVPALAAILVFSYSATSILGYWGDGLSLAFTCAVVLVMWRGRPPAPRGPS